MENKYEFFLKKSISQKINIKKYKKIFSIKYFIQNKHILN
jgi:hypothetical protein